MAALNWYVGVDWGGNSHQVCVLDEAGTVRGQRAFAHSGEGLAAMAAWLAEMVDGAPAETVGVAIETPRGPVVESLLAHGLAVHAINPRQLDRFRDRYSPAGAKDDRRDARVLASALRTDPHCLRQVAVADPAIVELREWTRMREELKRDRVRLTNRMRDLLWRYYPEFNRVMDDLAAPWAMALWKRAPTPAAARGMRLSSYAKLLKKHRIRRVDAATLKDQLTRQPLNVDPAAARAAETHVRRLAKRLAVVVEQLAEADAHIDGFLARLAVDDPVPVPDGDPQPGQHKEQRDATILRSMPGAGRIVVATLFAEADDALRRRDYHALRCLCGTAAVTKQSGRYRVVVRRLAVHGLLRDATYHWANTATQNDPVSRAKYQALRDRGHGHHRALRSVADRLLYVACAMLHSGTLFDPHHAGHGRRVPRVAAEAA